MGVESMLVAHQKKSWVDEGLFFVKYTELCSQLRPTFEDLVPKKSSTCDFLSVFSYFIPVCAAWFSMFIQSKMPVSDCSCFCFVFAMSNGQDGSELCVQTLTGHIYWLFSFKVWRKNKCCFVMVATTTWLHLRNKRGLLILEFLFLKQWSCNALRILSIIFCTALKKQINFPSNYWWTLVVPCAARLRQSCINTPEPSLPS